MCPADGLSVWLNVIRPGFDHETKTRVFLFWSRGQTLVVIFFFTCENLLKLASLSSHITFIYETGFFLAHDEAKVVPHEWPTERWFIFKMEINFKQMYHLPTRRILNLYIGDLVLMI